ncbi:SBBP repeat-containing protein [Microcoleus sp. FACHB-1515]|uniref:SBBP repeat-containing protein n=1 Tax=Cyanophyceae TaxID=3028117 RepID=UPI0016826E8E|nr:SBBP repeat-containing protein [Microcoleus sp. FACHB-1515]MBD2088825.1 SBBP repeat-containing protein [Microcoleus sp. FACHB-1515]
MVADRARNTLRQARFLTAGDSVRDFVGRRDRDDLYRIRLGSRSQVALRLGNVQRGAKVRVEIFSAKGAIGRIGRINFSDLTRRQVRQNLTRLGSSSGAIDRTLEAGQYYLRISPQRGESRYRLSVNATPISPSPSPTPAPAPTPVNFSLGWLRQVGTGGNDYAYGIAIDSSGNNIYVSGTTSQVSDAARTDSFVAQYDSSGNVVGASLRRFGSTDDDAAFGVAIDAAGNYTAVGITNLFIDRSNALNSRLDGSLIQFDSSGSQNWQALVESTISIPFLGNRPAGDAVSSVAIDAAGNLYVAGFTGESLSDLAQAFVAKYKPNGDREWLTKYGTNGADAASGVALDAAGNIYITGVRNARLNINSAGNLDGLFTEGDAFVAKFNSSGALQWDETLGTPDQSQIQDYARGIAVTADGTIYIAGQTDGTLAGQTSAGDRDAFIARYSTDGTLGWVKQFGTSSLDEAQGIAIAPDGSVYLSGETNAALFGQTYAGGADSFFAQFASNGDQLSVRQFGTNRNDESYNLRFDDAGNLYVIGQTEGEFAGQTSAGQYDVFIAKYTPQ